ncbi:metallo-beta-lactamase domain-containing protein 1 [Anopheles aquasalis]|uniref:metallo-beta-lactamase domain-containing protein 1 n=1 Tax=Anopheles aquasalis TaxID=42839 RepID=UPI00215B4CAD|nr:metallo-beta-lactamase domain-containing protein 1 [Anopheles aquasalis]XP_050087852.1 metallo-beta-lactamase domain-containing protein 1 [Anopheles aquasalis]
MNEVIVLNEGYSRFEDTAPGQEPSAVMLANCTCTLIKGRDCNVIVDTMTPWDGDLLLKRLQEHQLHPDDIDYVVSTHGHSDHLGNNNLFLGAKRHIVGTNISHRNRYYVHDFDNAPFRLTDDIEIQATPGHTMSCVTVLVAGTTEQGRTAIVGDLFERREDIDDERLWIEAGSEDPRAQRQHRARIAELADWIIPGHGAAFRVDASIRQSLRGQADGQATGGAPVTPGS